MRSIELVLLPIRGETGFDDFRLGISGGEPGDRADTKDDVLDVSIEDVSLVTDLPVPLPLGRDGEVGGV